MKVVLYFRGYNRATSKVDSKEDNKENSKENSKEDNKEITSQLDYEKLMKSVFLEYFGDVESKLKESQQEEVQMGDKKIKISEYFEIQG